MDMGLPYNYYYYNMGSGISAHFGSQYNIFQFNGVNRAR